MRFVVLAAVIASQMLCLGLHVISRRKIDQRNATIEEKRRELQPMAKIAAEVRAYKDTKDALERRINLINQLKMNQKGPSSALTILARVDLSAIDSIAIDDKTMTINSHAEIVTDAEVVEKRSAGGRYMLKVKI